jgi:transcriptional regulator of arginine metabolism
MLNDDILSLINQGVSDQHDLLNKLKNLGHELTQSSISRKLKQLGINKSQGVYKIIAPNNFISDNKISFVPPNLIVITTLPGHANVIASKIDLKLIENSQHPEFIGSIAGDDTIFLAIDISFNKIDIILTKLQKTIDSSI